MNQNEKNLLEGILRYFGMGDEYGQPKLETPLDHSVQHLREQINQEFALKAIDLIHYESVCQAFSKAHNIYGLGNSKIPKLMRTELKSQGVPGSEIDEAIAIVDKLVDEFGDADCWNERDAGWHPNLDEIKDQSNSSES